MKLISEPTDYLLTYIDRVNFCGFIYKAPIDSVELMELFKKSIELELWKGLRDMF